MIIQVFVPAMVFASNSDTVMEENYSKVEYGDGRYVVEAYSEDGKEYIRGYIDGVLDKVAIVDDSMNSMIAHIIRWLHTI